MIELTVKEISDVEPTINKLYIQAIDENTNFLFSLSYKIYNLINKLNPELEFLTKQKEKIFKKFGKIGSDGSITVLDENKKQFIKYLNEFLNTKIKIYNIFKFNKEELANVTSMTLLDIARLEAFIEDSVFEIDNSEKQKFENDKTGNEK